MVTSRDLEGLRLFARRLRSRSLGLRFELDDAYEVLVRQVEEKERSRAVTLREFELLYKELG